jgi:hypothetical protein
MKNHGILLYSVRLVFFFTLIIIYSQSKAQLNLQWVKPIDSIGDSHKLIISDSAGNVYLMSEFKTPIDVDPGPNVHIITPYSSTFADIFIVKFDNYGNFIWAKTIQGSNLKIITQLDCDQTGHLLIGGFFSGSMDCNPAPTATANITADSISESFLIRLDTAGNYEWSKHWPAKVQNARTDRFGNSWISGTFLGNIDFENGPGVNMLFNSPSYVSTDFFILKLDSGGNIVWLRQIGGNYTCEYTKMVTDTNGNGYFAGKFFDTLDIDPGPNHYNIIASTASFTSNNADLFLMKLDSNGDFNWGHHIGDVYYEDFNGICFDKSGYVIMTGVYNGTIDFDPGPGTSILSCPGSTLYSNTFLLKFDTSGVFKWVKENISSGLVSFFVGVDDLHRIYTCGSFSGSVDFDPGLGTFILSAPTSSPYILQLDSNANFLWCDTYISPGYFGGSHSNYVVPNGDIFSSSYFIDSCDFDPSVGLYYLIGQNIAPYSAFVAKFSHCTTNGSSITIKTCNEYQWLGNTYTSSGLYADTLQNMNGCDSLLHLNLSITHINDSVYTNGDTLYAYYLNPGATYQWLSCNGMNAIAGATNSNYTPTINGSYAVAIFEGGCSDTSICTPFNNVGIIECLPTNFFSLSPNPNNGNFIVHIMNPYICSVVYSLYDTEGHLLNEVVQTSQKDYYSDALKNQKNGVYLLTIQTLGKKFSTKVIKQ